MKEVIYYTKENWECPFTSFMDILEVTNIKLFTKIFFKINLLSYWKLWSEDIKYIWDKIYELRIKQSSNISRIFYFTYSWNKIIILDWVIKKENKLKQSILNKVKWYINDFLKRIWNI
jgi:phage-related protein